MGHGVGGTRQCVAYNPSDKAVAITARKILLLPAKALEIGLKITKPESQNTGIPVIYPVIPIVNTLLSFPTSFKIVCAIVNAAPVFSKIVPIIVPAKITIPIFARILPNPFFTVLITSSAGIPHTRPTIIAMMISTKKGY